MGVQEGGRVISQILPIDAVIYGIPAVLGGLAVGYAIGGYARLSVLERIGLGLIVCFLGGLTVSLLMSPIMTMTMQSVLLELISFAGGYVFGTLSHWSTPERQVPKRHVVFEPEDDEEFDREIEKALRHDR